MFLQVLVSSVIFNVQSTVNTTLCRDKIHQITSVNRRPLHKSLHAWRGLGKKKSNDSENQKLERIPGNRWSMKICILTFGKTGSWVTREGRNGKGYLEKNTGQQVKLKNLYSDYYRRMRRKRLTDLDSQNRGRRFPHPQYLTAGSHKGY